LGFPLFRGNTRGSFFSVFLCVSLWALSGLCVVFSFVLFSSFSIILRRDSNKGFVVLPRREVVERSLSWFEGFRRLSEDYEVHRAESEAMIKIILNRVKKIKIASK
jgi:hypothetical protein